MMNRLLDTIATLVANSPPNKIEHLASLVSKLPGPQNTADLWQWTTVAEAKLRLKQLINDWEEANSISCGELAAMLRAASCIHNKTRNEQLVELVWTGPSSELIPTRKTEQVLLQVIKSAQEQLFVTSFVAFKVSSIISALKDATDRGVSVSILLEKSQSDGGSVSIDGIATMKKSLPDSSVLAWENREDKFSGGKVHAKVAVADKKLCFISSANLTDHAMEKNMEAGVLITGGSTPEKLHRHLDALITTKQLIPV